MRRTRHNTQKSTVGRNIPRLTALFEATGIIDRPLPFTSIRRMPRNIAAPATLRALQQEAERMARLSPFTADRERFYRIAQRYREQAEKQD